MTLLAEPTQPLSWISATLASVGMHGGLALVALGVLPGFAPDIAPPPTPTSFTVTSISLEGELLQSIGTLPETPEQPVDDPQAAVEPEDTPKLEPVAPKPAAVEPVQPVATKPAAPTPGEVLHAAAVQPPPAAAISPIRTTTGVSATAQPVAPVAMAPRLVPTAPDSAQAPAPQTTGIDPAPAEVLPEVQLAGLPTPAPQGSAPALSEDDLAQQAALEDLMARIRRDAGADCLVALPQRSGGAQVRLLLIGSDPAGMQSGGDAILSGMEAPPDRDYARIDPRQCAALNFVRRHKDYPSPGVALGLTSDVVPSGARLTGSLRGLGRLTPTLLLIDDNGVVQDLARFTAKGAGVIWFDVPVSRAADLRETSQLLMVIAAPGSLPAIRDRAGQLADQVFPALTSDLADGGAIALVPFDVR